jgi:phage shock protein A
MSVFKRISTVFRANVNDMISQAEDPEKMLNQLTEDMREQYGKAREQVAAAMADERRLHQQLTAEQRQAAEWEQKAMTALRAGREDLATQALQRQTEHTEAVTGYQEQWEKQKDSVDQLKESLRRLQSKIDEAQRKKNLLIARAKRAEAQKKIAQAMGGISDSGAFDTFDRMATKVDQIEATAEASTQLQAELEGSDLEAEIKALDAPSDDTALLALKQKMGMLPKPASADTPRLTDDNPPAR